MYIILDAIFSVEEVLNREVKGKPVVFGDKLDHHDVVATAFYEVRDFGLNSGMPRITAIRFCQQAIFIEDNFQKDK